jgi:hypothetical protein
LRGNAGLQTGRRIGRQHFHVGVDPAQAFQIRILDHQRLGPDLEFLGIQVAVGDVARDAHQLLLAFEQAQAQALLRVFDIAAHGLVFAVNFLEPQVTESRDDRCQEQQHRSQRREHGKTVLAVWIEMPPPVAHPPRSCCGLQCVTGWSGGHAASVWERVSVAECLRV